MVEKKDDDQFALMWSDPVSRRRLLRAGGIGLGALAVGGGSAVLSACTADTPGQQQSASARPLSAALVSTFPALDPLAVPYPGTWIVADLWAERLYRVDPFPPRTAIGPELATEMPRAISPTTHRIRLREGVTFHDGSPFTSEDVVASLDRIRDAKESPLLAGAFRIVKEVRAVGPHEVELILATPTALLAQRLAIAPMLPKGVSPEALKLAPVGTGPYRVVAAASGKKVTLERFEKYAGDRKPGSEKLEISVVEDSNARVSGLRTEQFRVIEAVPASTFESVKTTNGLEAGAVDSYLQTGIIFHCGEPPFDDVRVRQAVLFAIDRDSITKTSFFGHAEPAWAGFVSPSQAGFARPQAAYRYDPERARQLLAEAGHAGRPVRIDFMVANEQDYLASQAPIIEQNLKAVGFAPNMVLGQGAALFSRVTEGTFNAFSSRLTVRSIPRMWSSCCGSPSTAHCLGR